MIVCIAEKPSVAKDIADILGARQRHEGYLEGNGYQVTWTFGHLCTLKEPADYTDMWKSWSLSALPMIPTRFGIKLIDDKGIEKQFHIIESLMQKADSIINCGDAGQEGELIQRWVMQKAGARCPVRRLWISSLTEDSIRDGFNNLKDQSSYKSLYEAGLCRAIGDWLLGMNATRLYSLKYASGNGRRVLSIGRVQTPTLALVVERQLEIDNFKPEQYWELKTEYRNVVFQAAGDRETDLEKAKAALDSIKGTLFTITDVGRKEGKDYPQRLYDLTSLQVDCNRKYGFSAEETLRCIQSLYEKKVTTYPRVDTTFLTDDMYAKCPQILRSLDAFQSYTAPLLEKRLTRTKRIFDNSKVTDHHAIIPTGVKPGNNLTAQEAKVFDLVARRFVAAFMPECLYATTTVKGKAGDIGFRTSGREILQAGWKALYEKDTIADKTDSDKEKDEERTLPQFTKGESGPHAPSLAEKWTQPPKPYTEGTLLRAMETAGKNVEDDELRDALKENGLGRPSTRAAIVETLYKRGYMVKERRSIKATSLGISLISLIHEEGLKSATLTGVWEKRLREIERGKYDPGQFIDELKQMVTALVKDVLSDNSSRL